MEGRVIRFMAPCTRFRLFNGGRVLESDSSRSENDVVIISGRSKIDSAVKAAKYKRSKSNNAKPFNWLHWTIMMFTLLALGLATPWTGLFVSFNLPTSFTYGGSWSLGRSSAGLMDMVDVISFNLGSHASWGECWGR